MDLILIILILVLLFGGGFGYSVGHHHGPTRLTRLARKLPFACTTAS